MTTVGEISVKITADLAPLRKAQADAKKIMGDLDKALAASAKSIAASFKAIDAEINKTSKNTGRSKTFDMEKELSKALANSIKEDRRVEADAAKKAAAEIKKAATEQANFERDLSKALTASIKADRAEQAAALKSSTALSPTSNNAVSDQIKKVGNEAKKAERPITNYATNIRTAGQFSQQAAFQFNDLAVQLASGQSAFIAITQQGAQLVQMFQPGTGIGAAAKSLGSAFVQFLINPLNLAIVAIAAASAAIPMIWEAFTGPEAETSEEVLNRVKETLQEIELIAPKVATQIKAVLDAGQGREALLATLQMSNKELQVLFSEAVANLRTLPDYFIAVDSQTNKLRVQVRGLVDDIAAGNGTVQDLRDAMAEVILNPQTPDNVREFATTVFQAANDTKTLETAIKQTEIAVTGLTPEAVALEQAFNDAATALDGVNDKDLRDKLKNIIEDFKSGEMSSEEFSSAIKSLSGLSFDNTAVIGSIQGVIDKVLEAVGAMRTLNSLGSAQLTPLGQIGPVYSDGGKVVTNADDIQTLLANREKSQYQIEQDKLSKKAKKRGGGGASKKGEGDRDFIENLRIETEYLQKQLDLMSLGYDERVRQQQLLDQEKAIKEAIVRLGEKATPDQIAAVKELIPLQQQLNTALQTQQQLQEDMSSAYQDAAEGLGSAISGAIQGTEDLGKALANVALKFAEAVIQAQILQSFTGADGKMTQGGGILSSLVKGIFGGASFDGGGYTGAGSRSGGVDGKGGFPAILHPNETVIDHTKGIGVSNSRPTVGGSMGPSSIQIELVSKTDSSVIMEIADTQIKSRAPAIVKTSVQQSQQQTKQNMPGFLANAQARKM